MVYKSNNVEQLKTQFNDFKFVLEEAQVATQGIDTSNINIVVTPKDTVNVYTIETVKGDKKATIEINYEILTNRTYVTNYDVKPLPVVVPSRPVYFPEVLVPEVRYNYV